MAGNDLLLFTTKISATLFLFSVYDIEDTADVPRGVVEILILKPSWKVDLSAFKVQSIGFFFVLFIKSNIFIVFN